MQSLIDKIDAKSMKKAVADVRSGDNVRVHQKIREAGKERIQIFDGLVIRTNRPKSLTASITVRRVASGIGVEKTFPVHAATIIKIEVTKRSKVRRNYLSYMRQLSGKGTRLAGVEFDRDAVNATAEAAEAAEAKIKEEQVEAHEAAEAKKANTEAEAEAKVEKALAAHKPVEPESEAGKIKDKPKPPPDAKNPAEPQNKTS